MTFELACGRKFSGDRVINYKDARVVFFLYGEVKFGDPWICMVNVLMDAVHRTGSQREWELQASLHTLLTMQKQSTNKKYCHRNKHLVNEYFPTWVQVTANTFYTGPWMKKKLTGIKGRMEWNPRIAPFVHCLWISSVLYSKTNSF